MITLILLILISICLIILGCQNNSLEHFKNFDNKYYLFPFVNKFYQNSKSDKDSVYFPGQTLMDLDNFNMNYIFKKIPSFNITSKSKPISKSNFFLWNDFKSTKINYKPQTAMSVLEEKLSKK